ncbi:MAG: polysaccharide deacetylase family protein [Cyanobacteriota bacterium]|nr:polysaccharide deacetylase family protein [Cyanobacteriota bacterium]
MLTSRRSQVRSILPPALYPWVHRGLKMLFPDCLWEISRQQMPQGCQGYSLTFDDGPHPYYTPHLLETLDQWGLKASFFVLGERAAQWPECIRAIAQAGHHIGMHGYRHQSFPSLSPPDLQASLHQTQQILADACQGSPTDFRDVRPPNGLFLPQTLTYLRAWQMRTVMWSVVPEDWLLPPVEVVVERICQQIYPGSLIVLHDGRYGGSQVAATVAALAPRLRDDGWQCLPLPVDDRF